MFAKVLSSAILGLDGVIIEVETDILNGLPSFTIVGLPDKAVEEARERVRSAIKNTGADLPAKRITINLAPADLPKEGPCFDLPIAISLLAASGQIKISNNSLLYGELSLNGSLRPTRGVLSAVLTAREKGIDTIFIPLANAAEGSYVHDVTVYGAASLSDVMLHILGQKLLPPIEPSSYDLEDMEEFSYDMKDIKGQEFAKRALEVAAAGSHNVLLKGPPGAGKTLLSRSLPSILPPLTFDEAIEVTKLYSISGLLQGNSIMKRRPFRNPHHTTSHIGLIGGSANPRPGEISLAHRGVLFLDEFPEFPRHVLEAMRQPMEDGQVVIARARERVTFPARFMLVAAANPCPCGFFGDKKKACTCAASLIVRYQKKISGPMLDRIDIHLEVPAVDVDKITNAEESEKSSLIRKRVMKARKRQQNRFKKSGLYANSDMGVADMKKYSTLNGEAKEVLKKAMMSLSLSARSYNKIIKVAQTIADLSSSDTILPEHVLEALQYRYRAESV